MSLIVRKAIPGYSHPWEVLSQSAFACLEYHNLLYRWDGASFVDCSQVQG